MKLSLWITATALALSAPCTFAQSSRIQVALDGQRVAFGTVQPMQAGRGTLIPLRPLLTKTGKQIRWEKETNTISIFSDNDTVSVKVFPDKNFVLAGNNNITLDTAPRIVRGQIMVPVEFFQKALGMYTQENLATGAVTLQTQMPVGDNQVRVMRSSPISRARARRRADIEAYNRNRTLANANYNWYLQQQDYNRYLNERAAWERNYRNYLNSVPGPNGGFGGYAVVPTINPSVSNTVAPTVSPYVMYLYNRDFDQFMGNRPIWQTNYQAYLNMLNQNNGVFPNDVLTNEINWQNYLQAREALIQQLQNNPQPNNPPR